MPCLQACKTNICSSDRWKKLKPLSSTSRLVKALIKCHSLNKLSKHQSSDCTDRPALMIESQPIIRYLLHETGWHVRVRFWLLVQSDFKHGKILFHHSVLDRFNSFGLCGPETLQPALMVDPKEQHAFRDESWTQVSFRRIRNKVAGH